MKRAIAIGSFAGVHIGHQRLLRHLATQASSGSMAPTALLLDSYDPAMETQRLFPAHLQEEYIMAQGIEEIIRLPLAEVKEWSPERFVDELSQRWGTEFIQVGENFRFGHARCGDACRLATLGEAHGIRVEVEALVRQDGVPISSTRIRERIMAGDIAGATRMLGRQPVVSGTVVRGLRLGRELGFPTANLELEPVVMPPFGVYLAKTAELGWGLISWGTRPTFSDGRGPLLEIFFLDWEGELYDRQLQLQLYARLRTEQVFTDKERLRQQISEDVATARKTITAYSVDRELRRSTG